jgi:hypothetical protein
VCAVYDVTRREGGARERVRGWSYDTLEGHFELGRISYEVSKKLDTWPDLVPHRRVVSKGQSR